MRLHLNHSESPIVRTEIDAEDSNVGDVGFFIKFIFFFNSIHLYFPIIVLLLHVVVTLYCGRKL